MAFVNTHSANIGIALVDDFLGDGGIVHSIHGDLGRSRVDAE